MITYYQIFLHSIKRLKYLLIAILTILIFSFIPSFKNEINNNNNNNELNLKTENSIENLSKSIQESIIEHENINIYSPEIEFRPIYKLIEKSYKIEDFRKYSLDLKCEIYFEKLFEYDPNWWNSPKLGDLITHVHPGKSLDLINLNIYNHCFMGDNKEKDISNTFKKLQKLFNNLDLSVYPYLTGKMPLFQHWNGDIYYGPSFNLNKILINEIDLNSINYEYNKSDLKNWESNEYPTEYPFWEHYRNNIHGTGIVISINDEFINEAILLIKNLRTLENELPIQFIHRGDLSNDNKFKLLKISRSIIEKDNKSKFPIQDIWFVDLSFSINEEYKEKFEKYFNKMLAYGFNSFQNSIILDTDIILFQKPIELLETSQFKISENLFFKDRNLPMHMSNSFIQFIKDTVPNKIDEYLFNINSINEEIWETEYFKEKYFHYMESGVVIVNRLKYWNAVILSMHLSFIQSTLIGSWGDKEHFWMGMLFSGFDDFQFDKYWTASVGEIININNNNNEDIQYHEICSAHPGHILSDNNELSWLNSGILNCPKTTNNVIMKDLNVLRENDETKDLFKSLKELENYYLKPIKFEGFIIPPLAKYNLDKINNLDLSSFPNIGLEQMHLCNGYTWCAFDKIGNGEKEEYLGILKKFTNSQIEWYNYIAENYLNLDL
ncbi:hypothetical protein C6P40_004387 [Pichia californica]|uniref:Glycosyltransferase family 71 protein n=1 Tax=Pichia californica TaxID=460514 RepID=A0A9P6WPK5_9ASCO|nr:hypothetical protein C6P40_004387 [[Candida] californica]